MCELRVVRFDIPQKSRDTPALLDFVPFVEVFCLFVLIVFIFCTDKLTQAWTGGWGGSTGCEENMIIKFC